MCDDTFDSIIKCFDHNQTNAIIIIIIIMVIMNYSVSYAILPSHVFPFNLTTWILGNLGNFVIESFIKTSHCTETPPQTFFLAAITSFRI